MNRPLTKAACRKSGTSPVVEIVSYLRALIAIIRQAARSALAVRSEVIINLWGILARIVLVVLVWRAAYGGSHRVAGVSFETAVAYAVFGAIFTNVLHPFWRFELQTRVRQGRIAIDLLRPVGLISQTLAQQVGIAAAALPRCVMAVLLGLALGAVQPPSGGVIGMTTFVLSTALGIAVALLSNLLISMTVFWTLEVGGALMTFTAVTQLASGALVPLWFMPGWLRSILAWLPFQAQVFTPLSVYFGSLQGPELVRAVAVQALWVLLLTLLVQLVWKRALHRVVVHGG